MRSHESIVKTAVIAGLSVLFAASACFLARGWVGGHFSSVETLRTYVASFGFWAPVILTLLQLFLAILPICPSFTGCIAGAALFGVAGEFWTNYIGISVGSVVSYMLAKRFGLPMVNKMVPMHKYEAYIGKINQSRSYSRLLFLAILLPLAPDNFLCYFSGLMNMPARKFITIIITAKPWCILFYSIFFAYFI